MRTFRNILAILPLAFALSLAGPAQFSEAKPSKALPKPTGAQLLSRASLSFSNVPFDTPRKKVKIRLTMIKDGQCETINMCQYRDANNVAYNFWDEDEYLVDKSLEASDFTGKPMGALGLGLARQKADVLKKASLFLSNTQYECANSEETNREGTGIGRMVTECRWTLGVGWAFVRFNDKGQLVYAQVTSSHYT